MNHLMTHLIQTHTRASAPSVAARALSRLTSCALAVAAICSLGACASMEASKPSHAAAPAQLIDQQPTGAGRSLADINGSHVRMPGSMSLATSQPVDLQTTPSPAESGQDAIGTPIDAIEPQNTVNLNDGAAQADLWARVRKGFAVPDLDNPIVRQHEQWYASRPEYVQRMTERSGRYLYHVMGEIERRHMPAELALLPFIESAFNPQALSVAKASGMWQFVPATGKDYDLKQNIFRDDRRDVLASTRAAMDYLQRLYNLFGDWQLALAAYNWGEGNVQRAIARNQRAGLPTDYSSLNMPAETRNYVPKLQAVKNIVSRPEAFGLNLPPMANHPYFVSVPVKRDIDAALASKLAGMSLDEFHALNPSLNKPVILANGTPQVLLPYDNAEQFARNLAAYRGALSTWTAWVVPKTMRPADAAKEVGMNEAQLRDINRIPPKMLVKAGSTLLVPRSQQRTQDVSEEIADNAMMSLAPDVPPLRKMVVRAGKRDSVAAMARRYGVSSAQVAQWNKLSPQARLGRGQQVVIYVPNKRLAAPVTVARATGRSTAVRSAPQRVSKQAVVVAKARTTRQPARSARGSTRTVAVASANTHVR